MERATVYSQLKALGLVVSKAGIVSYGGYDYGILHTKDFQTMDQQFVLLDDVVQISWVLENHDLFFENLDGTRIRAHGDVYTDQDRQAMELRMMPKSLVDLNAVFYELYPDADSKMYYDELKECDMIDTSIFGEADGVKVMDDKLFAIYVADMQSKLREHGFQGTGFPSETTMAKALSIVTYHNSRNAFREWVESREWDGVPRVRTWFRRLFGATAPPLRDIGMEDKYLGDVSEMWFVGVMRRQYTETKHEIVPVLISEQGIGKGNGIRFMAGHDCWYVESTERVDRAKDFLDSVRGCVVVELSESKQLKSDDIDVLKGFISKSSDHLRKPYAKYDASYPRHFGFIATSNNDNIFLDETGNRRFFPMYCDPDESDYLTQYDVEQVWAEALYLLKQGHLWYASEETDEIAGIMQEFSTAEDFNVEAINTWLDDPDNGYAEVGALITKNTIMENVFSVDPLATRTMVPASITDIVSKWSNSTKAWRKVARTVRLNGAVCRAWERVAPPGEKPRPRRLKNSEVKKPIEQDAVAYMRKYCREHGCNECGDLFPTDGMTMGQIELLMSEGFIYTSGVGANLTYRVGYVP